MRINTLAGSRRITEPALPPEPQYRWTVTTWIRRDWKDYERNPKADIIDKRTMTVIAPTEQAAKRKIEAALPGPPRPRDTFDVRGETVERHWQFESTIEEVSP